MPQAVRIITPEPRCATIILRAACRDAGKGSGECETAISRVQFTGSGTRMRSPTLPSFGGSHWEACRTVVWSLIHGFRHEETRPKAGRLAERTGIGSACDLRASASLRF